MLTFLFFLLATANIILSAWGLVTRVYWFFPVASYLIMRELLYKLFHLAGYHAQPELREYSNHKGSVFLPAFEKHTKAYLEIYSRRNKILQALYLLGQILWGSFFLWLMIIIVAIIVYIFPPFNIKILEETYHKFIIVALFLLVFHLMLFCFFKLKKLYLGLFIKLFKADILLYEHGQPIFAKKRKK
ncbi:hypothetical protein [Streptococcus oricebi]|uniref:Glycosyl-4,4'-diaponeurosporenoate acyltransferase n=1 Tax=Streptococcus oricebi TaxID=1547447 RepID=A0ABS5B2T7_9STRE|nr:hypothetical protein [Streptococcus oricebi]MBP2623140.1 hypothetical protein [Streptococcus oricebi]